MGDKLWSYFRCSRTKLRESEFCPSNEWTRSCLHLDNTKCIQVAGRDLLPQYRCVRTGSNSAKKDRRCFNQLGRWKSHRWPWYKLPWKLAGCYGGRCCLSFSMRELSGIWMRESIWNLYLHERTWYSQISNSGITDLDFPQALQTQIGWIVTLPHDWAFTRPATSPLQDGNQWKIINRKA